MAHACASVDPAITIGSSLGSSLLKTFISRLQFSAVSLVNEKLDRLAHTALLSLCTHRNIYVVVVPLKRGRGGNRHLKSPDEMDLEEVQCMTVSLRGSYSPVKKFASLIDFDCIKLDIFL